MDTNCPVCHAATRPPENLVQRSQPSRPGSYEYAQLASNTIRLLRLSLEGTELRGELVNVHLGHSPVYSAASYHWGDEYEGEIKFKGGRSLRLSQTLYLALLRFTSEPGINLPLLWIDQICINQNDVDEREHQVGIMSDIYSGAAEVMVWLGDEDEVDNFPQLSCAIEHLSKYTGKPTMTQVRKSLVKKGSSAVQGYRGLLSLWTRPWFERLWVRQEVALVEQVTFYCGTISFTLKELAKACEIQLTAARDLLSPEFRGKWSELARVTAMSFVQVARAFELFELVGATRRKGVYERQDLLDVLRYTFDLKTTKSHDRVYAIYHLSSATYHRKFWPAYEKSIEKLWLELATYLSMDHTTWNDFRMGRSIAAAEPQQSGDGSWNPACPAVILALSSTQENADCRGSLSWVPQFDMLGYHSAHKFDHYVHYSHCFAAGGKGEWQPTVELCSRLCSQATLTMEGITLSTVASIEEDTQQPSLGASPYEFESSEYWDFIRKRLVAWYTKCHNYAGNPPSYDFNNLLRQGIDPRWMKGSKSRPGMPNLGTFYKQVSDADIKVPAEAVECMYIGLLPFMVRDAWCVDDRDHRRILAVLAHEGRKGWVPESTVEGDSVILIKGAPFPFVVRKGPEDGTHIVVGDAYFDNLEEPTCWENRLRQGQLRVFHFR
ncbi:hypothetical protein Q7P35_008853 [Cladosporium inversicolor]